MGYVAARLWLDGREAERDERIGEHEGYATLYDAANDRYLGNRLPWTEALEPLMKPELRETIDTRFRVVPRCHCDPLCCPEGEWTGPKLPILRDKFGIDFEATNQAATAAWQNHVQHLLDTRDARLAAAAKRRASGMIALEAITALDPMEQFGEIRTARAALDALEVDAVVAARQTGASWTEIGVQLGVTRQAARERFMKYDPQGAEAA